jgi:SAM-dependent methyltransferase
MDGGGMNAYIMDAATEPDRIRTKTSAVLLDHHLAWAGVGAGDSFVDFGCASGEVVRAVHRRVTGPGSTPTVAGVDADPRMLAFAAEESARLGLSGLEYVQTTVTGPNSTPFSDDAFDHAWARWFLEYLPRPVDAVTEMVRVVRSGGRVTLIDIDGNCLWHHPLPPQLGRDLDAVMEVLATAGFDPRAGSKLEAYAEAAGLVDVRVQVEPYHWIVGRPDEPTAAAWRRKLTTVKHNYVTRLAPHDVGKAAFFDTLLAHVLAESTMTWSLAYLVQGTKP